MLLVSARLRGDFRLSVTWKILSSLKAFFNDERNNSTSTSNLSIKLPKLYYATGDTVSGRVHLDLKTDRRVNSIVIHLTGSEFCETSVLADIPFQRKWILDGATTLYGNKIKMNRNGTIQRVGIPPESQAVLIKAGNYSWPFSFAVPKNIPPSALYKNGKVKIGYLLHVVVDVPWSKSMRVAENIRIGIPYFVDPEKPPIIHRNEKKFVIHHRSTAEGNALLKLEASVDKPVTFTGDKLAITVNLENYSGRTVYSLKCKLKQIWVFGSGFFEKSTVAKIKHKDKKFPLEAGKFSGVINLIVPNCDLKPTIQNATLIRSSYHLTILAAVRTSPVRVRIPIVMGSFPPVRKEKGVMQSSALVEAPTTYVSKEEQIADMSHNTDQEIASEPLLIDWDAPAPGQFDNVSSFETPLVPEFAHVKAQPQVVQQQTIITQQPQMATQQRPQMPAGPGYQGQQGIQQPFLNMDLGLGLRQDAPPPIPQRAPGPESFALSPPLLATDIRQPMAPINVMPSEKQLNLMKLEKSLRVLKDAGLEFDSAMQWTSIQDEDVNAAAARSTLTATVGAISGMSQAIVASTEEIEKNARNKSEGPFILNLDNLSAYLRDLVNVSKMGDQREQQQLLINAKRIATTAFDQAEIARELMEHNPFSSGLSEDALSRMLTEKSNAVRDAVNHLVKFSNGAVQASSDRVNFLSGKVAEIGTVLDESNNPFALINTSATVDDVEKMAQQLSSAASLIVMASHGQYSKVLETVEKSVPLVRQLLSATKGIQSTVTRYPESTAPIVEHAKRAVKELQQLITTTSQVISQGSLTHPKALERQINEQARDVQSQTSRIVEQTRAIKSKQARYAEEEQREKLAQAKRIQEAATASIPPPAVLPQQPPVQLPPVVEPVKTVAAAPVHNYDQTTNDELKNAMAALATAAARLKTVKGGSPAELRRKALKRSGITSTREYMDPHVLVMNATGDVAGALKNLLNAARMAQDQRIENHKTGVSKEEVYHRDPTWSEGVVSAAKSVVQTMEQLIEASTAKQLDDDLVVTLARGVSSATAQLVAAERVRGDPDSDATKFLLMSAKGVASATSDLIAKTRDAAQVTAEPRPTVKADGKVTEDAPATATSDKVKELETALRITRLEKELAAARNEMTGIRKERYQ
ncbi:hypothetical protein PROFUN_04966 [Planoprotostelium fungivorum]|uniref:I/LWEQ domain-containing protein n=1 Tax=Planoprotostelium fungivorum TaxID=1890364 RepID=A0A2P6NSQ2_9EUKA|nr:hypothetical protein PROFUN_04938 [Planoprotostelium fungivorum]PRP86984.1 hypothetical protein PROFUN_04966 [Planoprotostelium fungivorum]